MQLDAAETVQPLTVSRPMDGSWLLLSHGIRVDVVFASERLMETEGFVSCTYDCL
jgi:hypothetical protein